jgi:hypothetical protein
MPSHPNSLSDSTSEAERLALALEQSGCERADSKIPLPKARWKPKVPGYRRSPSRRVLFYRIGWYACKVRCDASACVVRDDP